MFVVGGQIGLLPCPVPVNHDAEQLLTFSEWYFPVGGWRQLSFVLRKLIEVVVFEPDTIRRP